MDAISASLATHVYCIRRRCSPCRKSCCARKSVLLAHPSTSPANSRSWAGAATQPTLGKGRCQHRLRASPGVRGRVCQLKKALYGLRQSPRAWFDWFQTAMLQFSSSQEVPTEITEESKFVPLNADDPIYGPPALLLVGFEAGETSKIYQLLKDLDGEFLKVIHFTEDMISLTVWDAMHVEQQKVSALKTAESLPRMCIFSGLSGEEMMMFTDAFPETGLEPTIFAAMVPNSANKQLGEVIEEIMGDHEMMKFPFAVQSAKLSD